jgi:hypothetical protein
MEAATTNRESSAASVNGFILFDIDRPLFFSRVSERTSGITYFW